MFKNRVVEGAEDAGIAVNVFSIYDKKAQAYFNPVYYHYKGEALRGLEDAVQDKNSALAKHPSDFALYRLGTFNSTTGKLESCVNPEFVVEAMDFKKLDKEIN